MIKMNRRRFRARDGSGRGQKDGSQRGWKSGGRGRNRTPDCRHPKIKGGR